MELKLDTDLRDIEAFIDFSSTGELPITGIRELKVDNPIPVSLLDSPRQIKRTLYYQSAIQTFIDNSIK